LFNDCHISQQIAVGIRVSPFGFTVASKQEAVQRVFSSLNLSTGISEDNLINFGYSHDSNYVSDLISYLWANGVRVMDRGFGGLKFLRQLVQEQKYFVLRISNS
jgi:hypothetical protein